MEDTYQAEGLILEIRGNRTALRYGKTTVSIRYIGSSHGRDFKEEG